MVMTSSLMWFKVSHKMASFVSREKGKLTLKTDNLIYYSILVNDYSLLLNMIPKNTAKIILHLLKNVDEFGSNINQISKALHISVGSSFKILKSLEKDGLVYHRRISNASHYKLDLSNPETVKICELLLLSEIRALKGHAKIYAQHIQKFEDAEMIMLFGSVLKSRRFNDVDVLFLTRHPKKVKDFCLGITRIKTKPVVPLILKKDGLISELRKRKQAMISIIREGVVLKGESVFVEVIKNVNA